MKLCKVTLLTLSDCSYCLELKGELDSEGISYEEIDAYKFPGIADDTEEKFQTEYYPIVFIDTGDDIVVLVSETKLQPTSNLRVYNSTYHLVKIIKSYIK